MTGISPRKSRQWLIGLAVCLVAALAAAAIWRAPHPQLPDPQLERIALSDPAPRAVAPPKPAEAEPGGTVPTGVMGIEPAPSTAKLCDKEHWSGVGPLVLEIGADEVSVDASRWQQMPVNGQVGLAAWMSKCIHEGRPVAIRAAGTGDLLASYDAATGYRISD